MSSVAPNRMPRFWRYALYATFGLLWLTGCIWLVLHTWFRSPTEFGFERHSGEAPLLLVHGILATAATYLLGWISAQHIVNGWRSSQRRIGGTTLLSALAILTISGFALFFITAEHWRTASSIIHEVLGVGAILTMLQHWSIRR